MRLKSVSISAYKNLKDFSLTFDGDGFIDIFVGKNGSGKSNFLEVLISIFDHVYDFDAKDEGPGFDYALTYTIDNKDTTFAWKAGVDGNAGTLSINGRTRSTLGKTPTPDNILVYYSGQNAHVADIITRFENRFRGKIKGSDLTESPRFIGIGPAYKKLLILLLLLLPDNTPSRIFLCQKLGILGNRGIFKLHLTKPIFARKAEYDHLNPDDLFWGLSGQMREFLDQLVVCIELGATPGALHDRDENEYIFDINITNFRRVFAGRPPDEIFRLFNNLKILGMLGNISMVITLQGLEVSDLGMFSDGQFQSVYIFAISELFKDKNCITLLDEPDAFLHPEWQFDFLKQTHAISDQAAKSNHILMSSHSASTIAAKSQSRVRSVETTGGKTEVCEREKGDLIKSLSAGLITFSEEEARLNVRHVLKSTTKPIVFTEGISDEVILETAWSKLFPALQRPFEIQGTFGCGFLGALLREDTIYAENPNRCFFGLFDFDEAYNNWNSKNSDFVQQDPILGLVRKKQNQSGYFILIPVPAGLSVRHQAINPANGNHYKAASLLPIELLFHDVPELIAWFSDDSSRPGDVRQFKGSKTDFAKDVIPGLASEHFECFRPFFEFIESKIGGG